MTLAFAPYRLIGKYEPPFVSIRLIHRIVQREWKWNFTFKIFAIT